MLSTGLQLRIVHNEVLNKVHNVVPNKVRNNHKEDKARYHHEINKLKLAIFKYSIAQDAVIFNHKEAQINLNK